MNKIQLNETVTKTNDSHNFYCHHHLFSAVIKLPKVGYATPKKRKNNITSNKQTSDSLFPVSTVSCSVFSSFMVRVCYCGVFSIAFLFAFLCYIVTVYVSRIHCGSGIVPGI